MRSSSRNSRKSLRSLKFAAYCSLLLGPVSQAEEQHNFVLTAFTNGAAGEQLVSGNYVQASRMLERHSILPASLTSANSNNRCVALTATKQWDAAHAACDQAVNEAEQERASLPAYEYTSRKLENEYVAVALSNRAVLHWMSAQSEHAADDLKRAEMLSPKAGFVKRNIAALKFSQTTAVAKVAEAPAVR